jgi:hypothetical protein
MGGFGNKWRSIHRESIIGSALPGGGFAGFAVEVADLQRIRQEWGIRIGALAEVDVGIFLS